MKNSTLLNFLGCLHIRDYNLLVEENGFKMDFSRAHRSQELTSSIDSEKKSKLPSYLLLVLLFLFTNFLFAQQPACNLNGVLEAKRLRDGGSNFTINSEVLRSVPGTIYRWEFKSNTSAASFATQNGQPNMTINPGNKNGNFNVKLTVINPPDSRGASKTCSCTKSVSIGNL
ncbi:hypothetical protein [Flavobacterium wongokense]|uniref:hypothetical protein n=1 Tax=Flavobacterium wongokense TaxID=2910674 RepID=UPI001F194816|nr:hypothetical protein [Flavobacterium sp. WG47]MCF6130750.1 hypothetical protein [Flavobacterium sp. WG47]